MRIEPARPGDVPEITALYAHHVLHGTATYETVSPTEAEMAARLTKVADAGWPWLVARDPDGAVLGYAYASQFRDRAAYRFACENSIYIRRDRRGEGIGKALLLALLDAAQACGFRQMLAVIGGAEPGSIGVHAACGFVHAGRMHALGRKHGRWLDNVYMQIALGDGSSTPPPEEPQ